MTADNLPRRLLRFVRRNRRRNADWWADEWCREATERDALQARMDAVRAYCERVTAAAEGTMEREGNTKIPLTAVREHMRLIVALLDGDGEARP